MSTLRKRSSHLVSDVPSFRILIFLQIFFLASVPLYSQEVLKSSEEEYYDFLALRGATVRPTLNYRTLSDSVWEANKNASHPWENNTLGSSHPLFGDFRMRVYGPELFMSVNTASPYGQNDGVLWQGKGFNASLSGGTRFEGYGIALTLLPHFSFSQNLDFDIMPSAYTSDSNYAEKAEKYGYYGLPAIDSPQRFGDESFFDWDFGDSEIRYSWKTLTAGFGTQSIWLGPAELNPIIHSNNAPSYPKFDVGLRRQPITIPYLNWYIGDIEFRSWWGYLSESKWFDNDTSNDHNLITGLALSYRFPFLKELTFGFNRIMLSEWEEKNFDAFFTLLIPFMDSGAGADENDQRASIVVDYLLSSVGLNIYLEWGRNDYSPHIDYLIRYPFHTQGYTFGIKKAIGFGAALKGEILLELTSLECSDDYMRVIPWASTFYAHHRITQGHTNEGQWLGAGIGTGGNSQYLGFKLYFPKGYGGIFLQRRNPDLDYTWYVANLASNPGYDPNEAIRSFLDIGVSGKYFFTPNLSAEGSFVFRDENNPVPPKGGKPIRRHNAHIALVLKYVF